VQRSYRFPGTAPLHPRGKIHEYLAGQSCQHAVKLILPAGRGRSAHKACGSIHSAEKGKPVAGLQHKAHKGYLGRVNPEIFFRALHGQALKESIPANSLKSLPLMPFFFQPHSLQSPCTSLMPVLFLLKFGSGLIFLAKIPARALFGTGGICHFLPGKAFFP
jgi:hypothetical protein